MLTYLGLIDLKKVLTHMRALHLTDFVPIRNKFNVAEFLYEIYSMTL